jgi:protein-L-isoaspartate(D-aspartate) O-methyltransferase
VPAGQRDPVPVARHDHGNSPASLVLAARTAGVADDRVLAAIRATPRAAFVPAGYEAEAYSDQPLPIPHGQVTIQPSLSAVMIAGLGLRGGEQVLEIGTGYGYQTALLSWLAAHVVSIEICPDIAAQARRLRAQGVRNGVLRPRSGTSTRPPASCSGSSTCT